MPREKTPADGKPREPESVPSSPGQHAIDFTRSEQLAILAECIIPPQYLREGDRKIRVSPVVMKSVLKAIDNMNRGKGDAWPSFDTLALHCGLGRRTVVRAVRAIEGLSLVTISRRVGRFAGSNGKPVNHYRIVWSELNLLRPVEKQSATGGTLVLEKQSATGAKQSATGAKQSATGAKQSATVAPEPQEALEASTTATWEAAAELLLRRGMKRARVFDIVGLRARLGETPVDFLGRIDKGLRVIALPGNLGPGRLEKPEGALWYFLETGRWPIQGIIDPDAAPRPKRATSGVDDPESLSLQLARDMLRAGCSDEEIFAAQRKRNLPERLIYRPSAATQEANS